MQVRLPSQSQPGQTRAQNTNVFPAHTLNKANPDQKTDLKLKKAPSQDTPHNINNTLLNPTAGTQSERTKLTALSMHLKIHFHTIHTFTTLHTHIPATHKKIE